MKKKLYLTITLFFFSISLLMASNNLPLHFKILTTDKAEAPLIWNNMLILTAQPERSARFVGVAFDYENYSTIHPFEKNEMGIYIYTAPIPEVNKVRYRLVVDSLWMADPHCLENERDEMGIEVSSIQIPASTTVKVTGPGVNDQGKTIFSIRSKPDATVSIVGTFNGWDPYMTPMRETSEGVYSTELKLRSGSYFYYFIIDGKKAMDPLNFARARNTEGEEVCKIDINKT